MSQVKATLEFYFDVVSPASYLAWTQLKRVEPACIDYRPIFLPGIFKGSQNTAPVLNPAKARYMRQDFLRYAQHYAVPMQFNAAFPFNSLMAMRMLSGLKQQPVIFERVLSVLFNAAWVDDIRVDDADTLHKTLQAAQLDADQLMALAQDDAVKQHLQQDTEAAVARGVFGAPTFFVGEEMFFGQDRLDFVLAAWAKAQQ